MYNYWLVTTHYQFMETVNCQGRILPENEQTAKDMEHTFSAWAENEQEALASGALQLQVHANDTTNPLIEGSETFSARPMTDEEIAAMHAVFNK